MAVLHAEPLGWASFGVRIFSGNEELTQLTISAFKGKGIFDLGGDTFTVEPEGFFRSNAVLKKGGSTIARVRKPSLLRRRFEISSAGHRLVLESRGWRGREYVLLLGSREVGRVKREGFSGRKLVLDFPDDVPDFLQVLLAYVVVSQAKREAAAAASGG
ncbi:MAG: hypothetical protein ABIF09_12170 [Gemmatimonadota bacterium]